ncbi:MAG: hypothetical protein ACFB0B_21835 [Thermonemataceae bacterium]
MKVIKLLFFFSTLLFFNLQAQVDPLVGTFQNPQAGVTLRVKSVGNEYHGIFYHGDKSYAMKAQKQNNQLQGNMFVGNQIVPFIATPQQAGLIIQYASGSEAYTLVSREHELASVNVAQYFPEAYASSQNTSSQNTPSQNTSTPKKQPQQSTPKASNSTLEQMVASSQLVIYQRTSIMLEGSSASSLVFINFCPNGRFSLTYDSSYMVETDYPDHPQSAGAQKGKNTGNWYIGKAEGKDIVKVNYDDGRTGQYWVTQDRAQKGTWRAGNTKFTLQRGKAKCP